MGLKLFPVLDRSGGGQGERTEVDSQHKQNALSIVLKNYEQMLLRHTSE